MLETINLNKSLTKEEYIRDLIHYQVAMTALGYQVYVQQRPVIMVFEGWDASGKGGAIKRVTEKLDPRGYVVHPIAAPKGEAKTHHYLWRFWQRLPERGQIAIFDRSWYGRVMVERVEGFCTEEEWKRAYREINHFERQLVDFGTILLKFWVHLSREEQLSRFQAREDTPYKAWKLTDEDWRNRERWDAYESAVNDMLRRTSTLTAPWTIVEGNNKWYARIKVIQTIVDRFIEELHTDPFADMPALKKKKRKKTREAQPAAETEPLPVVDLPMIDRFEYGTIVIGGLPYHSDVFILPDGGVKRRRTKDRHVVRLKDIRKLIEAGPEFVIVGTGTVGNVRVRPKVVGYLQEAGIKLLTYRTGKACEIYKELRGQRRVAAILHITD